MNVGTFFFQAEDCIRDTSVTGVHTCALPISTTSSIFDFQTGIANVTGDALVIKDVANSYDYLTLRGGDVGIGTTSPGSILHIVDGAPTLKLQSSVSSAPNTISFDNHLGTQEGSLIHTTGSNTFRLNNVSGNSRLNLDSY